MVCGQRRALRGLICGGFLAADLYFQGGEQETCGGDSVDGNPDDTGDEGSERGPQVIGRFDGWSGFAFVFFSRLGRAVEQGGERCAGDGAGGFPAIGARST